MRDLRSNINTSKSLAPAARTASANGTGVDIRGYDSAVAIIECGAITDGTHTPSLEESDDDSTYTAVGSDDLVGSFAACTANGVQRVGYIGSKRYIRAVMTVAGATTGAVTSAVILAGHPHLAPV